MACAPKTFLVVSGIVALILLTPGLVLTFMSGGSFTNTFFAPVTFTSPFIHQNASAGSWRVDELPVRGAGGTTPRDVNDAAAYCPWCAPLIPRLYRRGLQFYINKTQGATCNSTCPSPATASVGTDAWTCNGVIVTVLRQNPSDMLGLNVPCVSLCCSEQPCPVAELDPGAAENGLEPYCVAYVPYGADGTQLDFHTESGLRLWTADNAALNFDAFTSYVRSRNPNDRSFALSGVLAGVGLGLIMSAAIAVCCQWQKAKPQPSSIP